MMKLMIKRLYNSVYSMILHPVCNLKFGLVRKNSFIGNRFIFSPKFSYSKYKNFNMGKNVWIGNDARILLVANYKGATYNPKIVIGNNVSIGNRFTVLSAATVEIKEDVLIASDVLITSENHGMNPEVTKSYADQPLIASDVIIGRGCWIGEKVSIMPGVTIGDKTIIAANSVVTKSFPGYVILAGIPAKIIKRYDKTMNEWILE